MTQVRGGPVDLGEGIPLEGSSGPLFVHERPSARRSIIIAAVSTVVFFTALGWVVVNAPGWQEVQTSSSSPSS